MNYFFVSLFFLTAVIHSHSENYSVFQENGKFGLKNGNGQITIPPVYEALGWSDGNFSILESVTGYKQDEHWGIISLNNQVVTAAAYFSLYPANTSMLIAVKRSPLTLRITTGCIDATGKEIIPFLYSGLHMHSMRAITYMLVGNQLKYGLIDRSNKTILPQVYQNIYPVGSTRYAVQNFKNKIALFTKNGKQVTEFVIDSIAQVQMEYAIYYQDRRQGLLDQEGEIVKKAIYREIILTDFGYRLRLPDEWHVLDASNTLLQKLEADSIVSMGKARLKIVTAAGTRLTDLYFNPIGEVRNAEKIQSFVNNRAVFFKNGKAGVIRSNGSIVLQPVFENIRLDDEYVLTSSLQYGKSAWSLYDTSGQKISSKSYDLIDRFNGSFFPALKNGFYGGIDKRGNEILACTYDSILELDSERIVVKFKGQFGILTTKGQWIVNPQPNVLRLINSDRYFETVDDLTFLKSMDGVTIYFTTNNIEVVNNELVEYLSGGRKWIINLNGQIIYREQPSSEPSEITFPSSEGFRGIKKNGKYGFIDERGRLRIANRYEDILPFSEGLAAIKILGRWGFINSEDRIVIQPSFDRVSSFEDGQSKVIVNGKYGLIDKSGEAILECRYDNIKVANNYIQIELANKFGLADRNGNIILQPKYDAIEYLPNGYSIVKQHGKFGVVNMYGISTIPVHFDHLTFEPIRNIFFGLLKTEFVDFKR